MTTADFCRELRRLAKMTDAETAAMRSHWTPSQWAAYYRHKGIAPPSADSFTRIIDSPDEVSGRFTETWERPQ